jgi:8-hydroxy-5-deazaflavin:NADPH oxidoreductase
LNSFSTHRAVKIGIIGSGNIGSTLAGLLANAGHKVLLSNSRGPESLRALVTRLGPLVSAETVLLTVEKSEVIILAMPWRKPEALPSPASVAGKIVIDAMNPYNEDESLIDLGDSTSSEETAKRLPGCRLVKAFNTIWYKHLAENARVYEPAMSRQAIFLAGDDAEAKAVAAMLIEDIGFAPVDTGSLREGGLRQQAGTPLFDNPMTGLEAQKRLAAGPGANWK